MDLSKFEYQRAEYVKAFMILAFVPNRNWGLDNYLLLHSGIFGMPFAIAVPESITQDDIGKYYIMHDDGNYDILTEAEFHLEYMPRPRPKP